MSKNKILKLVVSILICQGAGFIGFLFTSPAIPTWYASISKPALNPPSWVFGPVWTTLYFLMGIAAFLVWKKGFKRKDVKMALGVFGVQLFLNAIWSIIFFGLKNPGAAFVEIIFLWLAIVATIIAFSKISRLVVWLLVPYILWVSFAGYLNYSIWQLQINAPEPVACTMDAKQCPDGSYVGRVPPECNFAPCPAVENPCAVCINGCDTCPEGCDECLIGIEKKLKDPNMKWYYHPER